MTKTKLNIKMNNKTNKFTSKMKRMKMVILNKIQRLQRSRQHFQESTNFYNSAQSAVKRVDAVSMLPVRSWPSSINHLDQMKLIRIISRSSIFGQYKQRKYAILRQSSNFQLIHWKRKKILSKLYLKTDTIESHHLETNKQKCSNRKS